LVLDAAESQVAIVVQVVCHTGSREAAVAGRAGTLALATQRSRSEEVAKARVVGLNFAHAARVVEAVRFWPGRAMKSVGGMSRHILRPAWAAWEAACWCSASQPAPRYLLGASAAAAEVVSLQWWCSVVVPAPWVFGETAAAGLC